MIATLPKESPRSARASRLVLFAALLAASCWGLGTAWGYYHTKSSLGFDWFRYFYPAEVRWQQGRPVYAIELGYYNPPPVLVLMRLFSLAGRTVSAWLWIVASVAMIVAGSVLTADVAGWRARWTTWLAMLWGSLLSVPVLILTVVLGQTTAWVLIGLAGGMWLSFRGRDGMAGAALALTLVKPQLAFLVLPLLLYKRRWRSALAFVLATATAAFVSLAIVGPSMFSQYLGLQRGLYDGTFSNDGMQIDIPGIHGLLLQQWPHNAGANYVSQLLSAAVLVCYAWMWRGPWIVNGRVFAVRWTLLVVVTIVISPWAHIYDTSLLILPAVVLVAAFFSPELTRWDRRAIVVTLAALDIGPFLRMLLNQHFQIPGLLIAMVVL